MSETQPSAPQPTQPATPGVNPQPVWAAAPTQLVWRESPPLEFHQLLRGAPRYSWWRPLLGLLLGTAFYLVFSIVYGLVVFGIYAVTQGDAFSVDSLFDLAVLDAHEPMSLVLGLGSVAMMLPSVWLAMLCSGLRPTGRVWSAALKIRWGWLGRTLLPAVVAMLVTNAFGYIVYGVIWIFDRSIFDIDEATIAEVSQVDSSILIMSLVITLLLVPFQATAEEVVFRGAFMQAIGAWCFNLRSSKLARFMRSPVLPIAVPAILFGFAHIYDIWGWMSVVAMALVLGWLTIRTGGLEAAITLHVFNNWVALTFMVFAVGGETQQTSDGGGPVALISQFAGLAVYAWLVERAFKKSGEHRARIDYVQVYEPIAPQSTAANVQSFAATAAAAQPPQTQDAPK